MPRVLKKHLTPIGRKGKIDNRPGKGISSAPMPPTAGGATPTIQDYAKATPMANPAQEPPIPLGE